MFTCPKCKHDVKEVTSHVCPHCKLVYFDDTLTTWIGSSLYCDIIFGTTEVPPFAAAITYNEENKEYELVNMVGSDFPLYKNRKKITDKDTIDINDKIKLRNIIFDCNHPKISPIFMGEYKARLSIYYDNFEMFSVGNSPDADIILEELPEGKIYASIIKSKDSYFVYIPELGTTGSIFVDDFKLNTDELSLIDENDNIYIQDVKLPLYKIPGFIDAANPFYTKQRFPMLFDFGEKLEKEITIGQSNCDIVLQSEKLSYKHLTIKQVDYDNFHIQDNNSYTGVYLGDKKIKSALIQSDDTITFGNHQLRIYRDNGSIIFWIDQLKGKIRIDAVNIGRKVKNSVNIFNLNDHSILNDISFSIGAGELIGIMGPSGSGKTTMLKILAGVDRIDGKKKTGRLYYNFSEMNRDNHIYDNEISYLPQDDILFPDLTVYECLYYSAKLRMPNLKKDEIDNLIDRVLDNLNLESEEDVQSDRSIKDRKIGSINKPGAISGGQRKRINLAVELLSNPSIMFLDEPTSGLSSIDSERLMDLLQQINNMGNTIVTTIHQPGKSVFEKFDKVIILARNGYLAYYGSLSKAVEFFDAHSNIKFERQKNPANFILQALETRAPSEWKRIYEESEDYEYYVKRHIDGIEHKVKSMEDEIFSTSAIKFDNWSQFRTLISRNFKLKYNNFSTLLLLLLQSPLIALLVGIIFNTPLFDGPLLETQDRPIQDYKRIHYYTQLSKYKKKFDYLPPYKKFFISMQNITGDSIYVYSRIIDSSRLGGGWSFLRIGPHEFSMAAIKNDNKNAEEFPIKEGNYRFVISSDTIKDMQILTDYYRLNDEKTSFILNDSTDIHNWFSLNSAQKKLVWREKILPERKKYLDNKEFDRYEIIDTGSLFAFINPVFDGIPFLNPIKMYSFAQKYDKQGWYDIHGDKTDLYTSEREYKEKAMASLYLFFVIIISLIWIGMTNSVKDIVLERPIFKRERLHHLNLLTYVASKFVVLLVISAFQVALFLLILYHFVPDIPIDMSHIILIMLFTIMVSVGIGLIISAVSNNIEFAISLLPIILIPQLLLAGVFKHIGTMGDFLRSCSDLMVSRWSLEAVVNSISQKIDIESPYLDAILPFKNIIYPSYHKTVLENKTVLPGYFPFPLELNYIILFVFLIVVFWLTVLILKLKRR